MESLKIILTTTLPLLLSGCIAFISWLYQKEKEKRINVQNQLSDKKYQVYIKIINLFFGVFEDSIRNKQTHQHNLEGKMIEIVKELTIYGSDSVLKEFSYWKRTSGGQKAPAQGLRDFVNIIIAVRKDMGHHDTKADQDDILGMMIKDYEESKKQLGL